MGAWRFRIHVPELSCTFNPRNHVRKLGRLVIGIKLQLHVRCYYPDPPEGA